MGLKTIVMAALVLASGVVDAAERKAGVPFASLRSY